MSITDKDQIKHLEQVNHNLRAFLKSEGYLVDDDPIEAKAPSDEQVGIMNGNINAALIYIDRVIDEIECGDKEDTKPLDFVDDIKAAKVELEAFVTNSQN